MTSGLHHITAITRKIQANVDFYCGFLGLRLVKRTGGFEDAAQLHLFYGDAVASPGSLVSFLAWEDGSPGRVGHGAASEIAFAIRPQAFGFWLTRALQSGIGTEGPAMEFGEPVLRLKDPDGIIVKLVGTEAVKGGTPWNARGIETDDAIIALRGATLLSEHTTETTGFLARHGGFVPVETAGSITRMISQSGQILDIRDATGFWPAAPGTGAIDHVALRLPDVAAVDAEVASLASEGIDAVNVHDRKYFYSLYVREPAGGLIELATDDGQGFSIDEPLEVLGTTLFIPDHFRLRREDIVPMLPQFGLPGEPRILYRDLPFVYRIHETDAPDGSTLMLLHGTGGNEASLLPLGRKIRPAATLIGLRGRATEEGVARFFRRFGPLEFDQADIRAEADAFAAFVEQAVEAYGLAAQETAYLGYSNGANLLAAAMLLHPGLVRRAVLIRPVPVLDPWPETDLRGSDILILAGSEDPYHARSVRLADGLQALGAKVTLEDVDAGHELSGEDTLRAAAFLR
ncbi:VOC family protein [Rhizobium glycinendophyticum]|uniref:Ring-cleaving dioxygenase n=1 Tax=Rhizobium glycinendophyticum TaxID=2589807 RepID=A0A504U8F5_9HYPH|nr:VOC family protein [Rhizobium glycinendophyticum]TPP09737.1 ring-cleaving dioxygenase [Rhizobium glycinendophyticum]